MSQNGLYQVGKAQLVLITLCKAVASKNFFFSKLSETLQISELLKLI